MIGLDAAQLASLKSLYGEVIQNPDMGSVEATFYARATDGADVNFSTGVITEDETTTTIMVLFRPITNEVAPSGQVIDAMILVDQAQLPEAPDVSDAIRIDSKRYQVVDVKSDILRANWRIMVKEEASS